VLYKNDERFEIGMAKVLKYSYNDVLTVVTGGSPLFEVLKLYDSLVKEDVYIRVVDVFSVKPIDGPTIIDCANKTGKVFVVEDHYPEGGICESVLNSLKLNPCKVYHRAINGIPRSGSPEELYDLYGLSEKKLYEEVKKILIN
jgi:transketolase